LNDDKDHDGGRSTLERDTDDMIDHKPATERRKPATPLDESHLRQHAIGMGLRQMFDAVVQEEVPESFLNILRRADEAGSDSQA
jgi:hypothetical protein